MPNTKASDIIVAILAGGIVFIAISIFGINNSWLPGDADIFVQIPSLGIGIITTILMIKKQKLGKYIFVTIVSLWILFLIYAFDAMYYAY